VPWRGVESGHERDTACPETQGWDRRIALSGWPIQPWSQRTGAGIGGHPPLLGFDHLRKGKHLLRDEKLARLSPQDGRILARVADPDTES
jgi:hypothetical protein